MKDPCLECLVQVTCWQECDDKRNYATLISKALQNLRQHAFNGNKTYQKQFQYYMKQSQGHVLRRSQITRRASLMSNKD